MISEIIFQWYFIDFFINFCNPVRDIKLIFVEISTNHKLNFSGYMFEKNFNKYSLKFQKKIEFFNKYYLKSFIATQMQANVPVKYYWAYSLHSKKARYKYAVRQKKKADCN